MRRLRVFYLSLFYSITSACGTSAASSDTRISDHTEQPTEAGIQDARTPAVESAGTGGASLSDSDTLADPGRCFSDQRFEVGEASSSCVLHLSDELQAEVRARPGAINLYVDPNHEVADTSSWPDCTSAVWVDIVDECPLVAGHLGVYLEDSGGSAAVHFCPDACSGLSTDDQDIFVLRHVRAEIGCFSCLCVAECI